MGSEVSFKEIAWKWWFRGQKLHSLGTFSVPPSWRQKGPTEEIPAQFTEGWRAKRGGGAK